MTDREGSRKASTTPLRIDSELYAAARSVAPTMSRSITQQITHWARIGRELEARLRMSVDDVVTMLRPGDMYDDLDEEEQAVIRAVWRERMERLRGDLRLDLQFADEGRSYAELDADGNVVQRHPEVADGAAPEDSKKTDWPAAASPIR